MYMVKALGLGPGDRDFLDGDDFEAGLLDLGENGGGVAFTHGVGLDDAESPLRHAGSSPVWSSGMKVRLPVYREADREKAPLRGSDAFGCEEID
jgi:hypothetical protein